MKILSLIPPMTQLNTPYPSTAYLTGFLRSRGIEVVTELARNTREILDRVSSQGETIIIQRNQTLIAQIVPSPRIMSATQALEGLGLKILSPEQSDAWLRDSME